jgi:cytochrome P450
MLAVAALFGFDPDLSDQLMTCMIALFGAGADAPERSHELNDILTQIIAQRRAAPADDLTTVFLNHPKFTGEDEIHSSMVLTMSAGWETMQVWIANALKIMLTDARFNAQMRGGRLGVDDALAEVLLREPPMANMPIRYATEDTVLGGRRIARGDALIFAIAAAHGNPQTGPRHNSIDTSNGGHLAWGVGPHACPARRVSGIIAHTAIDTFLHRLPQTRLAIPGNDIPLHPSPWTRGPAQLPVTTTRTPVPEADHHA